MNITVEQLESLLNQQKVLCRDEFQKAWEGSDILKDIMSIEGGEKIASKIHWVRDSVFMAGHPNDVKVMKKYGM